MNRSLIQYCYVPDSDCSVMEGVFGWSWQDSDTLLHADSLSFINHSLSAWRENRSGLFTECRGCLATWWYSVINNNPLCLCFISHFSLVALFLFASQDDWLSDKHCKFGRMRDAGAILSCRILHVDVTTFRLYTRESLQGVDGRLTQDL